MSRRSPTNNRYQKGTTPTGATRKSAASVKPKKKSYKPKSSSATPPKRGFLDRLRGGGSGAGGGGKSNRGYLAAVPDTPEYKSLRRRWWVCLAVAIVLLVASLLVAPRGVKAGQKLTAPQQTQQNISSAVSVAALAVVGYSWWLDFKKIRPLIKEAQKKAKREQEGKK